MSSKYSPNTARQSTFSFGALSSDLCQLILSFIVKDDFRDIIHYSTICRSSKEAADHCPLWLTMKLRFRATKQYQLLATGEYQTSEKFARRFKLFTPVKELPSHVCHFIAIIDPSILPSTISLLPYQQAKQVRDELMKIYIDFHRVWAWHCLWQPRFKRFDEKLINLFNERNVSICRYIGLLAFVAFIVATYLMSDIENYSSSLAYTQIIGFACLYAFLSFFILYLFLSFLNTLKYELLNCYRTNLKAKFAFEQLFPQLVIIMVLLGILSSLIMLQIKLSSTAAALRYVDIIIPLWIWFILATISGCWMVRNAGLKPLDKVAVAAGAFLVNTIPLGFTLLSYHYDSSNQRSNSDLIYATIPFYPLAFFMSVSVIASIVENAFFFSRFLTTPIAEIEARCSAIPPMKGVHLQIIGDIIRTLLLAGMVISFLYFLIMLPKGQLTLGQAILTILVAISCGICAVALTIRY